MSRAEPSGGPGRIEDYALLSDLRTAALIGTDGSVDWLCLPRFDAPSCFCRLLGDERDGHWRIAPAGRVESVRRRYRDDSLVLETDFRTATGTLRLIDHLPPRERPGAAEPCLVRIAECLDGTVDLRMRWVIRFAYADAVPWVRRVRDTSPVLDEYLLAVAGPHSAVLRGDVLPRPAADERAHLLDHPMRAGQRLRWVMQWSPDSRNLPGPVDPEGETTASTEFWRDWAQRIDWEGPHRHAVRRSLTVLKGLTYAPTGGIVAAPSCSLPEALPGDRNWDYRYCWLRDATLVLLAMDNFGCSQEAAEWRDWLLRAVAGDPADLQPMYGIGGERHLVEWEADWLPGYQGVRPVRIGNAAYRQLQMDVFGEVLDVLHLARERGLPESEDGWAMQRGMLAHLERIRHRPDRGLWEVRGPEQYFTHSRLMVWVAFDRAVRAAEEDGLPGPVERWRELRDEMRAEILEHGYDQRLGAFTQYYGSSTLDAAALRIPLVGFLPGHDERVLGTIRAVQRDLQHDRVLVDRYSTGEGSSDLDGQTGAEGSFLACSFWMVDALALAGRAEEAERMFGELVELTNDVGLLAEEYDVRCGRFTGNFPQAFSHLALVNSAAVLYGGRTRWERSRR
ncbi:glycoside hydrolase family 15 protein [Saccharopolyspora sp. HNM0983]|uniref:Glycoside hydrolase family 15 protein n=1 Tax=Saccharopolyspora montiporae TaxID=2781240 RepID=A0A929FZX1_9PSEU|nr:glycoside hydrolase family 15 protein [Saccharopolyspora sp. HNM0983]